MAYSPIAFVIPQYDKIKFKNWWLKAYDPGTLNPKPMAINENGDSQAAKFELNSEGFPITSGGANVIPFVDGRYDMWLFPTAADADSNDTSNAEQFADNIVGALSSESPFVTPIAQPQQTATGAPGQIFTAGGQSVHENVFYVTHVNGVYFEPSLYTIPNANELVFNTDLEGGDKVDITLYAPVVTVGNSVSSFVYKTFAALLNNADDLTSINKCQTSQHSSSAVGAAFYSKDGTSGTPNSGNEAKFFDHQGAGWKITGAIELSMVRGKADGVTDNAAALVIASQATNVCMLDGNIGTYHFSTVPILPDGFSSLIIGQSTITGITAPEVNGRLMDAGVLEGIPYTPELGYSKIEIISGTLRQNADDRTQWDWIKDGQHEPLGVDDSVPATASGSALIIPFLKVYSKVGAIVCGPDESLANAVGFKCGASVGLGTFEIKASVNQRMSAQIWFDGATWQWAFSTGQGGPGPFGTDISSITFSGANITINHDTIQGTDATVTPWTQDGAVSPWPINIRTLFPVTNSILSVRNWSGGFVMTEDTDMSFIYTKRFDGGIFMDGTNGSEVYNMDLGNIWFVGWMVV